MDNQGSRAYLNVRICLFVLLIGAALQTYDNYWPSKPKRPNDRSEPAFFWTDALEKGLFLSLFSLFLSPLSSSQIIRFSNHVFQ